MLRVLDAGMHPSESFLASPHFLKAAVANLRPLLALAAHALAAAHRVAAAATHNRLQLTVNPNPILTSLPLLTQQPQNTEGNATNKNNFQ